MKLPRKVDVVVVGAGPTGLTLACTLRSANVDVLVLDKVPEGANTSRAAVIHARTLEVLDELDVTTRLVTEGVIVPIFTVRDRERVLARLDFSQLPTPYPYTLMLPQSRTEAILAARLAVLDGCVQRPWTVIAVAETALGAAVTASDQARSLPTAALRSAMRVVLRLSRQFDPLADEPWSSLWRPADLRALLHQNRYEVETDEDLLALADGLDLPRDAPVAGSLRNSHVAIATSR